MFKPSNRVNDETWRFHRIVESGSLEELKGALEKGAVVNAPGHVGQTALMVATTARDLKKMILLVECGADPELTDDFNSTSLRHAVHVDFAEGVRFLLSLGVERGFSPKYPLKKVDFDYPMPEIPLPAELKGVMSVEEWADSQKRSREAMRELGQNPTVTPIISDVQSLAVLQLFLDAGDELQLAPSEIKRAVLGLENDGVLQSTRQDYTEQKSPRYGTENPTRMELPFWRDMIRTGARAYTARQHFEDTDLYTRPGPVWCYQRFGSSLTPLGDGRFVQIGGEHEDFYDPDFCIYNDVVVHDGKGSFQIYGYPQGVFPPTDFHSATLVGNFIYIIGCLGYPEQRIEGFTPVYRLKLESWDIERIETTGEMPGWLHDHRSRYDPGDNTISVAGGKLHTMDANGEQELVPNNDQFALNLSSLEWKKLN